MQASARTVTAETRCVIDGVREELRRRWRSSEKAPRPLRLALAQASRMIGEILAGRGSPVLPGALDGVGRDLSDLDPDAAAGLRASLAERRDAWVAHATERQCDSGVGAGKDPRVGPNVIVVGGGNSAVDAVRAGKIAARPIHAYVMGLDAANASWCAARAGIEALRMVETGGGTLVFDDSPGRSIAASVAGVGTAGSRR